MTDKGDCISNNEISGCKLLKVIDSNTKECIECSMGLFLNENKECQSFTDPNCLVDFFGGTGEDMVTNSHYDWNQGKYLYKITKLFEKLSNLKIHI